MILLRKFIDNLKLSLKSLRNRALRHCPSGTERQVKNIVSSVSKNSKIYSANRKKVFNEALANRKKKQ